MPNTPKHIVIVAGEESGDKHASSFIRRLKATHPDVRCTGIGGAHMQAAGVELLSDLAKYGVTGISEVFRHIRVIRAAFKKVKDHLSKTKPDLLILVDYPGFNLRLAKFAKQVLGIRVLYYISPQIWAWKAGRIKVIQQNVDHMAVILPFEKKLYQDANVPVSFVGHPLLEELPGKIDRSSFCETHGISANKKIIAMLPGSRTNEVLRHIPTLRDTAIKLCKDIPDLHFVIPVAQTLSYQQIDSYFTDKNIPYTLIKSQAKQVMSCCDVAVVASGTASLECSLINKPMCIFYKVSFLSYLAASAILRVKYIGLCNLLQNKMLVPELLQYDFNVSELSSVIERLLTDYEAVSHMKNQLTRLKQSLSSEHSDCRIENLIADEMQV